MQFYAKFDYVNPYSGNLLIKAGSYFGLELAEYFHTNFGIDMFTAVVGNTHEDIILK
jgi:hypothetical protein